MAFGWGNIPSSSPTRNPGPKPNVKCIKNHIREALLEDYKDPARAHGDIA